MGGPKRGDHEQAVQNLEELEIEFLFATEHGVCCAGKPCKKYEKDEEFERFT